MKNLIIKIFGHKTPQTIDFSSLSSVLLKPIGDAIGDSIVHLAHIKQLKTAFPHIKIGVLVTERCKAIYEQSGLVDIILDDNVQNYFLQSGKWALYLDFHPSFTSKSLILDKILNANYVINFGKKEKKYYNLKTIKNYDVSVSIPEKTHFKDYLKHSPLGSYLPEAVYELKYPSSKEKTAFWRHTDKIKILLNPQGSTRMLPYDELDLLLSNVLAQEKVEFLLTNTSGSEDYFAKLTPRVNLSLADKTSLFEYFSLIRSADIVVSVDGGCVHIACALGKPLLSFYSNYEYNLYKWYPVPKKNIACLVLTNSQNNDNNYIQGYDMNVAAKWLNQQIDKIS